MKNPIYRSVYATFSRSMFAGFVFLSFTGVLICASVGLSEPMLRATDDWSFSFPRDHGRHSNFEIEWWYLSGNLRAHDEKEWGYQFVIFRRALVHFLGGRQLFRMPFDGYVGHFVITDVTNAKFACFQTWSSSIFNFAGASDKGLEVWLDHWRLEERNGRIFLQAARDDFSVSLEMVPEKLPVWHGENGVELKGIHPGEASHHYSVTSLKTTGQITWSGRVNTVQGKSWFEREFGTKIMSAGAHGWDWFSLMLDNNVEVMLTLWRSEEKGIVERSFGTIVFPDGSTDKLKPEDILVRKTDSWTSPQTTGVYPMGWDVIISQADLRLVVRPVMKAHEILGSTTTGIDYWEGPVRVSGTMDEKPVSGKGYVELVGYVQPVGGKF